MAISLAPTSSEPRFGVEVGVSHSSQGVLSSVLLLGVSQHSRL